jgi:hypothetical protein
MGNLNPFGVIRDNSSNPSLGRGVHMFVHRITGSGGSGVATYETKLKSILAAIVTDEAAVADTLAVTIGSSTTYPGTATVAFTPVTGHTYSVLIIGIVGTRAAVSNDTITTATTYTYEPLKGT